MVTFCYTIRGLIDKSVIFFNLLRSNLKCNNVLFNYFLISKKIWSKLRHLVFNSLLNIYENGKSKCRVLIKLSFLRKKTFPETKERLDKQYRDSGPCILMVNKWFTEYRHKWRSCFLIVTSVYSDTPLKSEN